MSAYGYLLKKGLAKAGTIVTGVLVPGVGWAAVGYEVVGGVMYGAEFVLDNTSANETAAGRWVKKNVIQSWENLDDAVVNTAVATVMPVYLAAESKFKEFLVDPIAREIEAHIAGPWRESEATEAFPIVVKEMLQLERQGIRAHPQAPPLKIKAISSNSAVRTIEFAARDIFSKKGAEEYQLLVNSTPLQVQIHRAGDWSFVPIEPQLLPPGLYGPLFDVAQRADLKLGGRS